MRDRPHYTDPLDAADAVAERTAMRVLERFSHFFHVSPAGVWAKLLFPLMGLLAGAVLLTLLTWGIRYEVWGFLLAYSNPVGAVAGPATGAALGIHPALMIGMILYIGAFGGLFLVWNLEHLTRLPRIGPRLRQIELKSAERWARHRRLRRLGLLGLALFVLLPIPASGLTSGAIIGRFGGFQWGLVWLAIFAGSAVRAVVLTFAAYGIVELF